MNPDKDNLDKSKFWDTLALFPFAYYGFAVSYSFFHIFALRDYEPKDGQWGSFKVYLLIDGFETCVAFMGYLIGLGLLKTAAQQMPRRTLALITTASAFLSRVVVAIMIFARHIEPVLYDLGVYLGSLLLIPTLLGLSLVKICQICLARRQSIQR